MKKVLILASGPSAHEVHDFQYKENDWTIVSVNNGWLATDEWDHWIRSDDFKGHEPAVNECREDQVLFKAYSPIIKKYGGFEKCGYSITLTAGYYSLYTFKPDVVAFLGADMNYTPSSTGHTHIYGVGNDIRLRGVPDPDRMAQYWGKDDPDFLTNIYLRFLNVAEENGCKVYNLSSVKDTRLPYPKAFPFDFD